MLTLADLLSMGPAELDKLYVEGRSLETPSGVFSGIHLGWLPREAGEHPCVRPILKIGFEIIPFGIDFTRRRWFFFHRKSPRIGRFTPRRGRSLWQPTDTIQLHYDLSRLPPWLRVRLYDELQPLSPDLCLGLGGLMVPPGNGLQFYFALRRIC